MALFNVLVSFSLEPAFPATWFFATKFSFTSIFVKVGLQDISTQNLKTCPIIYIKKFWCPLGPSIFNVHHILVRKGVKRSHKYLGRSMVKKLSSGSCLRTFSDIFQKVQNGWEKIKIRSKKVQKGPKRSKKVQKWQTRTGTTFMFLG